MSANAPIIFEHSDLAVAWARLFNHVMDTTRRELRPVVLSIGGFTGTLPAQDVVIRAAVDRALRASKRYPVDVTAMTIFPYKHWIRLGRPGCNDFAKRCIQRLLPRMRALDSRNQYGTYFERMMAFSGTQNNGTARIVNQLQHIIDLLKMPRRRRETAMQISCFDPAKDHTGQIRRGFPCLQQIGISRDEQNCFSVSAFYPTQFIFDRAYGNYLGLCQLGHFIAHESGRTFKRLNCFITRPERGGVRKSDLAGLHAVTLSY